MSWGKVGAIVVGLATIVGTYYTVIGVNEERARNKGVGAGEAPVSISEPDLDAADTAQPKGAAPEATVSSSGSGIPEDLVAPGERWKQIQLSDGDWLLGEWCLFLRYGTGRINLARSGDGLTYRFRHDIDGAYDSGVLSASAFQFGKRRAIHVPDDNLTFFVDDADRDLQWTYFTRERNAVNELKANESSQQYNCSKCFVADDGIGGRIACNGD